MAFTRSDVSRSEIGTATVLLLGVLGIAYGYFQPNKVVMYVGLILTAAGVLNGVLRIVMHGDR